MRAVVSDAMSCDHEGQGSVQMLMDGRLAAGQGMAPASALELHDLAQAHSEFLESGIEIRDALGATAEAAVVHGRICWVKTEYSEDALPLDENFAELLRELKKKAGESELLFPSPKTGHCYHASPIQQDYIRRAGWCLVPCPVCKAAPGTACTMVLEGKGSLPKIPVHDERRGLATKKKFGSIGWHTFRHNYRLWLDETGAPLGVQQKLMRHADIRTTMNQYGDSAMPAKRKANSKVVEMVLVRKSSLIEYDQNVEAGAVGARRMG